MYEIRWIRDEAAAFDAGRVSRGLPSLSETLIALDDRRKAAVAKLQVSQERRNAAAKVIGQAMGRKDTETADRLKAEVAELKAGVAALEAEERESVAALRTALEEIPNTPLADVPVGADEHGNVEVRQFGQPRQFGSFTPRSIFRSAKRSGSWISTRLRNCRAPGSWC